MAVNEINQVDLAFVVDTTGSMGALIDDARKRMVSIIEGLVRSAEIDLQLGFVEYRDHPPQDSMLYRVHPFTGNMASARRTLEKLRAMGGGDEPEAVLDGVLAACRELSWRPHARKLMVLVGDAPPHGTQGQGDSWPKGCPCGETIESVSAAVENTGVILYAIGLTHAVEESFDRLSHMTGGEFFPAGHRNDEAIDRLADILRGEFGNVELDRKVLETLRRYPEASDDLLAEQLCISRSELSASMVRLVTRDLITQP